MAFADFQGQKFHYQLSGPESGANVPLVFVHGLACTHEDWAPQVDFFSSRHTVISCDLPGHGLSDPPADGGSIENCSAALTSLLNRLDLPPAVLVGHSMGCRVILQTAIDAPRRTAGLVMVDGSRVAESDPATVERQVRRKIADVGYAPMMETLFSEMFVDGTDPGLKERLIRRALALPEKTGTALFAGMARWDAGKAEAALARVDVPALVLQSTYLNTAHVRVSLQSGDVTPWMRLVQDRTQDAELDVIGGVGHFSMLEAPDIVNEKIQAFIEKSPRARAIGHV